MEEWAKLVNDLEKLVRLQTYPIAFKRYPNEEAIKDIPRVRRIEYSATWCQILTLARTSGWTIAVTKEDILPNCAAMIGLREPPIEETINLRTNYWVKSTEDAKKMVNGLWRIPADGYEIAVVAPLASNKFEPDVVAIYGTPAQMVFLMCGLQRMEYQPIQSVFSGESSCSDGIPKCYVTGEPTLMVPCFGERRFGHCGEDQLSLVVKPDDFRKICEGVKALSSVGVRYPITPLGSQCDVKTALNQTYPYIPGSGKKASDDSKQKQKKP